jgi:hypothetical protein
LRLFEFAQLVQLLEHEACVFHDNQLIVFGFDLSLDLKPLQGLGYDLLGQNTVASVLDGLKLAADGCKELKCQHRFLDVLQDTAIPSVHLLVFDGHELLLYKVGKLIIGSVTN